jgi:hypothetical protein
MTLPYNIYAKHGGSVFRMDHSLHPVVIKNEACREMCGSGSFERLGGCQNSHIGFRSINYAKAKQ